jgi:hypothetical protein
LVNGSDEQRHNPADSVIEMMSGTSSALPIAAESRSILVCQGTPPTSVAFAMFTVTTDSVAARYGSWALLQQSV